MKDSMRQILFNNLRKYEFPDPVISLENHIYAATINKNLAAYGYCLDADSLNRLSYCSLDQMKTVWTDLTTIIKTYTGADDFKHAKLFYPNFPEEVMEKSEFELYSNAVAYYFCQNCLGVNIRDKIVQQKEDRPPLIEFSDREPKIISFGNEDDLVKLMKDRVYSTSMSEKRLEELELFTKEYKNWADLILDDKTKFASKENLVKVANLLYENGNVEKLKDMFRDTSDVLRFIAARSNQNLHKNVNKINLTMSGKEFRVKLTKKEKTLVKNMLDKCPNLYADIWKEKALWKKAMRFMDTKNASYRVVRAFDYLASNQKKNEYGKAIKSNFRKMQDAVNELRNGNVKPLDELAKNLPGLFVSKFAECIDNAPNAEMQKYIADLLKKHCTSVPAVDLLKIKNLMERKDDWDIRVFRNMKHTSFARENVQAPLEASVKSHISKCIDETVAKQLTGTKVLGNVYVDPNLKNNIVPLRGEREASGGAVLTKYSHIPSDPEKNLIAMGIHWKNQKNGCRADIDVSVQAYDKDFCTKGVVSYYELVQDWGVHSGDYTDGGPSDGPGVMEMIICDKNKLKENGIAYLITQVTGFSCNFSEAENVKFLRMEKEGKLCYEDSDSKNKKGFPTFLGEPVEYSQIEDPIKLNADAPMESPLIYDVEKDEYIWMDETTMFSGIRNLANPAEMRQAECSLYKAFHNEYPDMYQLFMAYANVNGKLVDNIKEADTVFVSKPIDREAAGVKEFANVIDAYQLDTISKEYEAVQPKLSEEEREELTKELQKKNDDLKDKQEDKEKELDEEYER